MNAHLLETAAGMNSQGTLGYSQGVVLTTPCNCKEDLGTNPLKIHLKREIQ